MGLSSPISRLPNSPQAGGTRPFFWKVPAFLKEEVGWPNIYRGKIQYLRQIERQIYIGQTRLVPMSYEEGETTPN